MLWGNTAYCVKLSGKDLLRYSNKNESVGLRNVRIITLLLRKWCHNNKHIAEFGAHVGRKTTGIDMVYEEITSLSPYVYSLIAGEILNTKSRIIMTINSLLTACLYAVSNKLKQLEALGQYIPPPSRILCNHRCLFVCLSATLCKNFRTDLDEIFRNVGNGASEHMIKFRWDPDRGSGSF